jgi:predicted trehalose synthase
MATQIILPESVRQNLEREAHFSRRAVAKEFNRQLEALDPDLELVWVPEGADFPGLVPGRWHIRRANTRGGLDAFLPVLGPDGEYMEPHSGVLDQLRKYDLQNGGLERLRQEKEDERRARERDLERFREQRRDAVLARYRAMTSPGVSFHDRQWTNKAGARKG